MRRRRSPAPPAALLAATLLALPGAAAAQDPLERARELLARGEVEAATTVLEEATAGDDPRLAGEAHLRLARNRLQRAASASDLEAVARHGRAVAGALPASRFPAAGERAAGRVIAGEADLLLGRPAAAAVAFAVVVDDEPLGDWTAGALLGLARVAILDGAWNDAAALLQEIADSDLGSPTVRDAAARRRALLHRHALRPLAGEARWTTARRLTPGADPLPRPDGIAASDADRLIVSDGRADGLRVLAADGARLAGRDGVRGLERPFWDPYAGAWVAAGDEVAAADEVQDRAFPDPGRARELPAIVAGARGPLGHWFLVSRRRDRLVRVDPAGVASPVGPAGEPVDVARDDLGRILLLDARGDRVERLDLVGAPLGRAVGGDWREPAAVAVDALGQVYVLDRERRRVELFSPDGLAVAGLGPSLPGGGELEAPADVAVDGSGRLYVADPRAGTVWVVE